MNSYEPMDIYTPVGDKVRFEDSSQIMVHWGSNDDPDQSLTRGSVYTVERTEVHSQHTKVYLVECPGKRFNSCSFSNA